MVNLCDYGCGGEAKYELKNKKKCCHQSPNQCPALRTKNSNATKKSNKFTITGTDIKVECKWCKNSYSKSGIIKHENACYLNSDNLKLCPVCEKPIKDYKYNKTCSSKCARLHFSGKYSNGSNNRWDLNYRTVCFNHHGKK